MSRVQVVLMAIRPFDLARQGPTAKKFVDGLGWLMYLKPENFIRSIHIFSKLASFRVSPHCSEVRMCHVFAALRKAMK